MSAHPDRAIQAAAYRTIRELIAAGLAGLDERDSDRFVVDAPQPLRDHADVALDHVGGEFVRDRDGLLACVLPWEARLELGLDEPGAPRLTLGMVA